MNDNAEKTEAISEASEANTETKRQESKSEKKIIALEERLEEALEKSEYWKNKAEQRGHQDQTFRGDLIAARAKIEELETRIISLKARLKRSTFALEKLTDSTRARTTRP